MPYPDSVPMIMGAIPIDNWNCLDPWIRFDLGKLCNGQFKVLGDKVLLEMTEDAYRYFLVTTLANSADSIFTNLMPFQEVA